MLLLLPGDELTEPAMLWVLRTSIEPLIPGNCEGRRGGDPVRGRVQWIDEDVATYGTAGYRRNNQNGGPGLCQPLIPESQCLRGVLRIPAPKVRSDQGFNQIVRNFQTRRMVRTRQGSRPEAMDEDFENSTGESIGGINNGPPR